MDAGYMPRGLPTCGRHDTHDGCSTEKRSQLGTRRAWKLPTCVDGTHHGGKDRPLDVWHRDGRGLLLLVVAVKHGPARMTRIWSPDTCALLGLAPKAVTL